jgi:hypothetical protein
MRQFTPSQNILLASQSEIYDAKGVYRGGGLLQLSRGGSHEYPYLLSMSGRGDPREGWYFYRTPEAALIDFADFLLGMTAELRGTPYYGRPATEPSW